MPEPADVSVTIIWPSMVNRSRVRRPQAHPHGHLHSSRRDDESAARPKRQKERERGRQD